LCLACSSDGDGGPQGATSTTAVISDPINATRVLCGGLSLPTLATLAGRAFFPSCSTTLNQTLLVSLAPQFPLTEEGVTRDRQSLKFEYHLTDVFESESNFNKFEVFVRFF
jgi:hypothetical protein